MQGLAGVPWAKTQPIMLYGKDLDVCPTNGQHSLVSRRVASLFQEMHAFVALHSGCEPVRLILRQDEKVARCNWRSNLPEISR
jgi:hypothetical protein